jgi:formylglycine-generating enzyme required for sulfatase activity
MTKSILLFGLPALILAMFCPALIAEDATPAPAADAKPVAAASEVTLIGILMGSDRCYREGQPEEKPAVPILFAFDGAAEVKAAFNDVFKDLIAGKTINYEQSKTIEEEMHKHLKYYVTTGDITEAIKKNTWAGANNGGSLQAVTGVLSEKDGKKWITPSKVTDKGADKRALQFKYPEGFYAPDKPFKMPGKTPLILKVTDTLSLKCILIPPGDFMFRKPFWYIGRWADEYPRHITLTKPFWLAEMPVTQEMWDAVMGAENDFSTLKDPQRPVRNMYCADILKFLKILSEQNKRIVRLPGDAEWEYAARVGTSNPQLPQKYKPQDSTGKARNECLPVKSKQPNAWGIYDMMSGAFELARDKTQLYIHKEEVDPYLSAEAEEAAGKFHKHWGNPNVWFHEEIGSCPNPANPNAKRSTDESYGSPKFRVAVEATPEEIEELAKQDGK